MKLWNLEECKEVFNYINSDSVRPKFVDDFIIERSKQFMDQSYLILDNPAAHNEIVEHLIASQANLLAKVETFMQEMEKALKEKS